jgi:hypothetical protein
MFSIKSSELAETEKSVGKAVAKLDDGHGKGT